MELYISGDKVKNNNKLPLTLNDELNQLIFSDSSVKNKFHVYGEGER